MSLAILVQVSDELRRLAIAGSGVAGGDFRLKKLIPPLEKAGEKAPVFAKVAQSAQAVVDSDEKTAPVALLELAGLVNAVLYTQGETGLSGELQPIETTDLGARQTQASARLLKPLLEALSTTGSGRLELVKDAFDRGAFSDLRLVKPALAALDDPYPEIADFVVERVLPLYGQAILPELRRGFDRNGKAGHLLRLRLMHQLDPHGTRELIAQTLDDGSKELKVVAIECLGDSDEDLAYLLEQSKAKAKDVRAAALGALTKLDAAVAVETVQKAAAGADLALIVDRLRTSRNSVLLKFLLTESDRQLAKLLKLKDKTEQGPAVMRLQHWLGGLVGRDDPGTEAWLLKCFDRANDLTEIKSEPSGADVNELVAYLMANGSPKTREKLIAAQESLTGPMLSCAFAAARRTLSPGRLYDLFSPSLLDQPDKKSKKTATAFGRLEAIRHGLSDHVADPSLAWRTSRVAYFGRAQGDLPPLDSRWLDAAIATGDFDLVQQLARPNHPATNRFLSEQFAARMKKSADYNSQRVLDTMVRIGHPEATKGVLELLKQIAAAPHHGSVGYWIGRMIPDLPKSSAGQIETLLPSLPEKMVDSLMEALLALKNKPDG